MTAIVLGAGGFIGHHLCARLSAEGHRVVGADLKLPEYSPSRAHEFQVIDLREAGAVAEFFDRHSAPGMEVYQLAADMGGAGYVFSGENDADIMRNSSLVNLNVLGALTTVAQRGLSPKVFYSSSACIYPERNQLAPESVTTSEGSAYPAEPDSEYGWEKLYAERLYQAHGRNCGIEVRIGRFHNIFGPEGAWNNGREKSPAAICRKVAQAGDGEAIELWGDGTQTRSYLYIDDCLDALARLMKSEYTHPVNIGSEESISINDLARLVMTLSGKRLSIRNVPGPTGVNARTSDNDLIRRVLAWEPRYSLGCGMSLLYGWIHEQVGKHSGTHGERRG